MIPHSRSAREDSTIPQGESRIETAGVDGEKTIVHTITLTGGIETDRKSEEKVTREPVEEVTLLGTYVAPRYIAPVTQPGQQSVYYKNCTAARNAGAAPVYEGQPGYGVHLDRDRDGIGCE